MSALAPKYQQYLSMADDIQPMDTRVRSDNENVTEIIRFLQSHVPTPAQSTGAKDMIKAGQRRLKLALRNKRGTESKLKAEEASRQLAALQQQGSFPRSQHRKWGNKQSVASTASSSKSATDLSYKSSSKRDVEGIGRPWLEHPLEKRDEPGSKGSSQVSSLDLRDLASFVEAAVNFSQADDTDPPPYQPLTEQCATPTATPEPSTERMPQSDALSDSVVTAGESVIKDSIRKVSNELPIASSFHRSAQPWMSSERLSNETQNLETKPKHNGTVATKPPPSSSSSSSRSASAPTTPVLKLFPDAISPRTSNKQALRISTGRSSTPKQSLPSVPASQSTPTLPSVFESNDRDFRTSSNSLPKIQEHDFDAHGTKQSNSAGPERTWANSRERLEPRDLQSKHARRPSSLPPGTIDAFPIPAPAKPLPTVPEPNTQIDNTNKTFPNQQITQLINMRMPIAELPGSMPPGISISSPSSPEDKNNASRGRDSPFPRLLGSKDLATTPDPTEGPPVPIQPRRGSLGKVGRSREAKVRSLIMKDLARSRHLKSSSKGQIIDSQKEEQTSQPCGSEDSCSRAQRRYQSVLSSGPSWPPPTSPPPSDPPRHTLQSRRFCTPPAGTMAAAIENYENLSNSTASRKHQIYPKNSAQNFEMKPEKKSMKQKSQYEDETPLPSSDDEGPVGDLYWSPPRQTTRRRRRGRPEPIIVNKPVPERGRSMKKHLTTNSMSPATLQNYSRRSLGKTSQAHLPSHDQQTSDLRSRHSPESKPNHTLEGRIEHLERQNKILQAALLAALDVGVKQDLSSLLGASVTSTTTPPLTGTSFSTTTNTSGSEASSAGQDRHAQNGKVPYQPESWIASPDSFKKSYDSDVAETRELEQMIDEFDLDWLSDRSSTMH
ncbi:hypothetical protein BDW67DRAFT_183457 [Aspergillus spinulosporus]